MVRRSEFLELVLEQMRDIADVRVQAMFGGHGVYVHDTIVGIVIEDRLYLKAAAARQRQLAASGVAPFRYTRRGKRVTTSYFEAPAEVFEDRRAMQAEVRQALLAAARDGKKTGNG